MCTSLVPDAPALTIVLPQKVHIHTLPQILLPGYWWEGISCLEVLAAPTAMETSLEARRAYFHQLL